MKKLAILIMPVLLLCGCSVRIGYNHYSYTDLNGNTGVADFCYTSYGSLVCELSDGTKLSVQNYKGEYKD